MGHKPFSLPYTFSQGGSGEIDPSNGCVLVLFVHDCVPRMLAFPYCFLLLLFSVFIAGTLFAHFQFVLLCMCINPYD